MADIYHTVIDGMTLPMQSSLKYIHRWISKGERNAKGDLLLESLNQKRELNFEWAALGQVDMSKILACTDARLDHTITYYDPGRQRQTSGRYYHTDVSYSVKTFAAGSPIYTGVTFSVIEI